MLALDFVETVTHRVEKVLVGGDDGAVHLELDHRLRPADRGRLRQCIARGRIAFPQRHKKTLLKYGDGRDLIRRRCTVRIPIDPYSLLQALTGW